MRLIGLSVSRGFPPKVICLAIGNAGNGESIEEAIANLREATSLDLEEFPAGVKGHPLETMFSVPAHA